MKTLAKLLFATFVTTLCVGLGFAIAGWLDIPIALFPLFLLPAIFVFFRFDGKKVHWIKTTLFFLTLGVLMWLREILPARFGDHLLFIGPALLIMFSPYLSRTYGRIEAALRHSKSE